jgi:ribosomal protein S18 acetylase RimI-like enzyme
VSASRHASPPAKLRPGRTRDIDALVALENAVFTTDNLSRRSFRHFLTSPKSSLIVAEESGKLAGYALVLYPARSTLARLYSIAVAPHIASRGIGPLLLAAAEAAAARR